MFDSPRPKPTARSDRGSGTIRRDRIQAMLAAENRFNSIRPSWHGSAIFLICGTIAWFAAGTVLAATGAQDAIDWWGMGMQLLGGLAVFLFGMEQMAEALKRVAGNRMKAILGKLTTSRIMGLLTGAFVTAIIQSSSVTTLRWLTLVSCFPFNTLTTRSLSRE